MTKKYVIYLRVSTKRQGDSGLGLEAQQRDIDLYLQIYSEVPYEVLATFTETKSGGKDDRTELNKAISLAKAEKAELLVAKLDRLSRKVSFIAALMEQKGLVFRVASMPHAEAFQLHLYAALAEQERAFISARTKAALREAKARGVVLGGLRESTKVRNETVRLEADDRARQIADIVLPLHAAGRSLHQIAAALNSSNMPTARGGTWYATTVKNTITRLTALADQG